jgi:pilus assembly protein Flp/PilA
MTGRKTNLVIITHATHSLKDITMLKTLSNVITNEDGATLVEYGLVVALIAAVAVVAVTALGNKVIGIFTGITAAI